MNKALASSPSIIKITSFAVLALLLAGLGTVYFSLFNWVTVYVGEDIYRRVTMAKTVEEVLEEVGVELRIEDYVYPPLKEQLGRGAGIVVVKARPFIVNHDGNVAEIWSVGKKVADILKDAGVKFNDQDVVLPPVESSVLDDKAITVVRVESELLEEQVVVSHSALRVPNSSMYRGQERVVQTGQDGKIVNTLKVTYHDNEEVERTVISSEVVVQAKDKVVEYGTISSISRGGYKINITRVLDVLATAYCSGVAGSDCPVDAFGYSACTGPYANGLTSTGIPARAGKGTRESPYIIAVDPKTVPLNTLVFLTFPGGGVTTQHGRIITDGFAIAADVGSAIKGNRIDVLFDNHWVAWYFGHRQVRVFVVDSVTTE
jgi:uncharacterized protein YabE (DUF348 family)